ncbi:SusD/RagB family nutrient-binding outer membrane lipoprotein [Ilyomonas limi]|uniref:SusD/RagB family nutrient-binding outer membrane lipoprotein n=1 Tax=Ilyomonas limi TaxID=2575867 RepID=A0A4U3L5T6_9BACT|nr:SusD/RagB family nutrient-binding outer membrane lipoprotein [Ilyomonas limi]TKK69759.1 SusD/RagB family nutrient-binding outer membrane lipoprotein [Ilyomonas limi]
MTYHKLYKTGALLLCIITIISSCKKNFGEINTDPSVVIKPDVGFLLTYTEDQIMKYQYTEWIWESMEQLLRFTQHLTTDPYELTSNVNLRYNTYYQQILPNLFEIRKQIAARPDSASYQKMSAVTYVLQVLHGIKVTDMNGSIPYEEAIKGRSDNFFSPQYNTQQQLFDIWIGQLDNAIAVLSDNATAQVSYDAQDVYYKSDWTKWVKLANSLKLRIAARLELQENDKTKQLFQEVMQDPIGPITSVGDQLTYVNEDYFPFGTGGEITYRSQRFATIPMVDFMKKAVDPRLFIYFDANGLQGSYKDTLAKYNTSLPSFIEPDDPLIMYQGGPCDFTTQPTVAAYLKNPFPVGNNNAGNTVTNYFLISPVNTRFFSPNYNNIRTGLYKEVAVTAAEIDLTIAEFIQKGYAGSVNTNGTAADWYNKGITASIQTMNDIAEVAGSTTAFSGSGDDEINAYLQDEDIKLNGTNDLERIYIQEHLNFFRNPNEAFVFCRRTGYPKKNSDYYPREPMNEIIPRRFWTLDPGETNRQNWEAAMQEQGFTPNAQDLPTLSSQRVWYDKPAPDFGEGN